MAYYDSFMATQVTPVTAWKDHTQAFLDEEFENSSDVIEIEEEIAFGTLQFKTITARVTTTLDSKVGDKQNDDYRTIFFSDISYKPPLGQRFRFYNNVWIVYNTDNINSLNSACYVRRCNNTINTLDYYGKVHQEPCVIDLKPTKSSFVEDEAMWSLTTRQVIMYQKNSWTDSITYNTRILFGDQTYRVGVNLDFNRLETFATNSVTFVKAYLDLDLLNEFDNVDLGVADYHLPNFSIILPTDLQVSINSTGTVPSEVRLNNTAVQENILWSSSDTSVLTIDSITGAYEALSEGTTIITAKLKGNTDYFSTVEVQVVETPEQTYETKVTPEDYYIPLNQKVKYDVFEYLNGIKQNTTFTFECTQLSSKYYKTITTDNSITISNLKQSSNVLLKIEITNNRTQTVDKTLYVELGGLF